MTNLVLGIDQPSDCLLGDILERVAELIKESDVDLAAKLRRGLVEELHNLLGHEKRGARPVEGVDGEEEDLADKVANLMVGRESGERGDGELEEDGLEVPDESLQKVFRRIYRSDVQGTYVEAFHSLLGSQEVLGWLLGHGRRAVQRGDLIIARIRGGRVGAAGEPALGLG